MFEKDLVPIRLPPPGFLPPEERGPLIDVLAERIAIATRGKPEEMRNHARYAIASAMMARKDEAVFLIHQRWSDTLVDVHVYLPDHDDLEANRYVKALREVRAQAEGERESPFKVGGYEERVIGQHVYVKVSNVPPDVVERVRSMNLPKKTRIETRLITP